MPLLGSMQEDVVYDPLPETDAMLFDAVQWWSHSHHSGNPSLYIGSLRLSAHALRAMMALTLGTCPFGDALAVAPAKSKFCFFRGSF